ncbi:hypothetical protein A2473_02190 [candidate division WWE3 bacterium RIFOXYC2_FULL_42_13]|uniref:Uncharacterized protein n=2 Tax=Katanobacteria TaxID=422282 RepID=A0A0G1GWH0_UNCKA|nr:MAG: hypothetical protein UV89_C0011G0014 [candidate division WWE3 bacterium GW2011_GWB2_43_22]OGC58786.1 MAG: hypothetical protein A2245_03360 [candidate division WWE3 bacterium RIFOXYA2_FULL_43_12]OGC66610.1 MAG: hypothetical protein A2274_03895 [candidate division WWE3 bacterium RIFOXYA12_FULL_43_11]OGC71715.1 MAG: hypothetical protein A2337_03265 [candidate division WWE3 bacterium RIFOXYB2_FULL_43_9]OGC73082.1 MAG: hypothetical protein A2473_02190 [candidate division WWE3 bacterium RIFOX
MTETQKSDTNIDSNSSSQENTVVVRVPKPNLQVVVLGLIALITLFQTFQLMRISSKAGALSVKSAPTTTTNSGTDTGTDSEVPESMVGGC